MARLILSAGMFSAFAATIAVRSRGFISGSPPDFAAIAISLIRRVNILPRLASSAPFLCLMVAHFEWPDIALPHLKLSIKQNSSCADSRRSDSLYADSRRSRIRRGGKSQISLDVKRSGETRL